MSSPPGDGGRRRRLFDELHYDAVRITGGVQDRLELTARLAAETGLEVWYCPFTNGLDRDGLMAFVLDGAERADRLRRGGAARSGGAGTQFVVLQVHGTPSRPSRRRVLLIDGDAGSAVVSGELSEVIGILSQPVGERLGQQRRAGLGAELGCRVLDLAGVLVVRAMLAQLLRHRSRLGVVWAPRPGWQSALARS
ncbi:hypothetical protein [Micromonospora sp. KC207]|uniref:hypothetical protein n=1 Tax=Micromonospora sp. KC207 TaxID=2530377 RepID=UPI001FB81736|nr:hypothetical protein [Micromonospora sp. KC207]